ncbi:Ribokinase [Collimonas arenae]|uniref:Ribokinase n=1 Tax=Collimonas arenae TaxID=279058 RepID=A0A0A1FKK1_9BURK|nr:Ribokinase [Collimonas arenae]
MEASTSEVSVVDKDVAPFVILLNPLESEVTWLKPVDKEEMPLEVDEDRDVTLPLVIDKPVDKELTFDVLLDSPVDSELILLVLVGKPVEVEVDKELTLLLVLLRPVDNELMPLFTVLNPLDTDDDKDDNWPKLTASVVCLPAATLVRMTGAVAPAPPNVTLV